MQNQPPDPFHLDRFTAAQAGVYTRVLEELRAGEKRSHWMWFIFPQIRGLGASPTSQRYAIASQAEARAYFAHPVLGARLLECTAIVNSLAHRSAAEIFGWPDELKFGSSMTLFSTFSDPGSIFSAALNKYFSGTPDQATLRQLGQL